MNGPNKAVCKRSRMGSNEHYRLSTLCFRSNPLRLQVFRRARRPWQRPIRKSELRYNIMCLRHLLGSWPVGRLLVGLLYGLGVCLLNRFRRVGGTRRPLRDLRPLEARVEGRRVDAPQMTCKAFPRRPSHGLNLYVLAPSSGGATSVAKRVMQAVILFMSKTANPEILRAVIEHPGKHTFSYFQLLSVTFSQWSWWPGPNDRAFRAQWPNPAQRVSVS